MATLTRTTTSEWTLSVDGDDLVLRREGEEIRYRTATADLDEILKLSARRTRLAVKEARAGGDQVQIEQVRALCEKLSAQADKLGSAQIEARDEARQRETRMTPGIPKG